MPDALAPDPFTAMAAQLTPKRAVSYIRVSTREQAQRGGSEEGFSLPAQREANKRKAQSMGALVVKEFADRGESARSANRPELQKMLAYLKEDGGIDYVIVHKLDRLARNRADDVEINRAFEEAGVRLVSTSENIDQTPGGMLLHGIMSSIAEFYSRNLANEVIKGMGEKARNGGTLGKAPLGYVNVRGRDEHGREVRTVELDQQRAPLLRLAFSEYATGNWTVSQLAKHLAGLGLDVPATPSKPARPITKGRLHTLLRHPYYKGVVQFQGVEYAGKHEPLVDEETWQAVQAVLGSHRSGERERMHNHFLKSTVVCGQCGSRLLVQNTKNGKGVLYPYFICARRQRLHDCSFKAVLIEVVEAQMQEVYRRLHVSETDRQEIERYLLAELARIEGEKDRNVRSLTARRTNLEDERRRLLQAHYGGAVPLELLKEEQDRLGRELAGIQRQLDAYQADAKLVRAHVEQALDLLEDCYRLYMAAPDHLRKQLNQVFFERVLVNPAVDEEGRVVLPGEGGDDGAVGELQDADDGVSGAGGEGDEQEPGECEPDDAGDEPTRRADEAPCSVRVTDTGSDVCLEARLNRPFDQLASPRLRAVARIAALRKSPTSTGGGRRSSAETATGAVYQGEGLYSDAVVPPAGLEPARP
ncbi:recombinase family protein [Actinomyces oris]